MQEPMQLNGGQLIISYDKVQLKDGVIDQVINYPSQFRFGIQRIEINPIVIGTKFKIDLKDDLDRSISIELNCYLNYRRKKILAIYEEILERLWEMFFKDRLKGYRIAIENNEVLTLGKFMICRDWIKKLRGGQNKDIKIDLESAVVLRNWDKLFIHSKFDPDQYVKIDTFKEWNSPFIYAILDDIIGE